MHPFTPVPRSPAPRADVGEHGRRIRWPRTVGLALLCALALVTLPLGLAPTATPSSDTVASAGTEVEKAARDEDPAGRSALRASTDAAVLTTTDPEPIAPVVPALVDEVVTQTNAERTNAGLPALTVSPCATEQATARTALLVAEDRFEHDPLEPVLAACAAGAAGENLALGYPTASALLAGWMGSDGHRANILSTAFSQIGVACSDGPRGPLCAQVFLG